MGREGELPNGVGVGAGGLGLNNNIKVKWDRLQGQGAEPTIPSHSQMGIINWNGKGVSGKGDGSDCRSTGQSNAPAIGEGQSVVCVGGREVPKGCGDPGG